MIRCKMLGLLTVIVGWMVLSSSALSAEVCGALRGPGQYGPYDFWTEKDKLPIVEGAHFTPEVENLIKGKSSTLGGDIDYTLRAIPNHPRALLSMMRLGEMLKTERPQNAHYTVACYMERAVRFRPEDAMARMIYGVYLAKHKKSAEALEQLQIAVQHASENANLHYNLGLVFFDLGKFDESLQHAHIAYRLGFTLPGLRNKLESAGKWQPLPDTPQTTSKSSTESSTASPAGQ